jgi:hypothetical protein
MTDLNKLDAASNMSADLRGRAPPVKPAALKLTEDSIDPCETGFNEKTGKSEYFQTTENS